MQYMSALYGDFELLHRCSNYNTKTWNKFVFQHLLICNLYHTGFFLSLRQNFCSRVKNKEDTINEISPHTHSAELWLSLSFIFFWNIVFLCTKIREKYKSFVPTVFLLLSLVFTAYLSRWLIWEVKLHILS